MKLRHFLCYRVRHEATIMTRHWIMALGLLAVLLILVILALPFLYPPDRLQALILQLVAEKIGRAIEAQAFHFEMFPQPRLELSELVVRADESAPPLLEAQRLELMLSPLALIRQRMIARRLLIEALRLELHRDATGRWNLRAGAGKEAAKQAPLSNILKLMSLVREVELVDGDVSVIDEFHPDGMRMLRLTALHATIRVDPEGDRAAIQLFGTMPGPQGPSTIALTGMIAQGPPADRLAARGNSTVHPAVQFEGALEARALDTRHLVEFFWPRPVPAGLHGTAHLSTQMKLTHEAAGYDLVFSQIKADVAVVSLRGQARLSGLFTAPPTFTLTFSSTPASLDALMQWFPMEWLPPRFRETTIERQINATVEVVTATVTGTFLQKPRIVVTGEMLVSQGQALVGRDRTPASGISATILVEPDSIRAVELSGGYGRLHVHSGEAVLSGLPSDPVLEVNVTGQMSAADLVAELAKRSRSPRVSDALTALQEVQGDVLLDLRLSGPVGPGKKLNIVQADARARAVQFRSPLLPRPVSDLKAHVRASETMVELNEVSGRLGGARFEAQGRITRGPKPAYQGVTVQMQADAPEVLGLLPVSAVPRLALQGTLSLSVAISGPLNAPRFKGAMEWREAGLTGVPSLLHKPTGTPVLLEFEGTLSKDAVLNATRLNLVLPSSRLMAQGKIRLGGAMPFETNLTAGPVSLGSLAQALSLGPLVDGRLDIALGLQGEGWNWKTWRATGQLMLSDGLLRLPGNREPIRDISLRLQFVGNGVEIKRLALTTQGSDIRVSGQILHWDQMPSGTVQVESSQLDLGLLIPKGTRETKDQHSPVRKLLETVAATSQITATVLIDHAYYDRFLFTDLSCRIRISHGALEVSHLMADTDEGDVAARMKVLFPERHPAQVEASLRISGIPFHRVLSLIRKNKEDEAIKGWVSLAGALQGHEQKSGRVLATLTSLNDIQVVIEEGRILNVPVLSRLLKILNLPALLQGQVDLTGEGLPFDYLIAVFSLDNGIITAKKLLLDSPILKISGAGRYNAIADQLDMVLATSPLGSYSELLKRIPLFGKLFAGERQGLDTALFEVKGSLKEPDVNYLPIQSFAKGLTGLAHLAVDLLRNAIMLPKDLLLPKEAVSTPLIPATKGPP